MLNLIKNPPKPTKSPIPRSGKFWCYFVMKQKGYGKHTVFWAMFPVWYFLETNFTDINNIFFQPNAFPSNYSNISKQH